MSTKPSTKKTILLALVLLAAGLGFSSVATANCFIAKDQNKILKQEGNCKLRAAPCSTFKIPLALMGYNEGILLDEKHPEWPFQKGYTDWLEKWKQPHNPMTWMQNSCLWYSQQITKRLGADKFQAYLRKFNYGNQDVSGDKGQHNMLIRSWISSSLQISPIEQVGFLQKLVDETLPVSAKAIEKTKAIVFLETLKNGWKLYGKTGTGSKIGPNGIRDESQPIGWFVGWATCGNQTVVFARHIDDGRGGDIRVVSASQFAKSEAKEQLEAMLPPCKN